MSTIGTTVTQGITLGSPGYYSPLTIGLGGAVVPGGTADAIYGSSGTAGTLVNAGSIVATGTHAGIDLKGGGTVANSLYLYGGVTGVYVTGSAFSGAGTVTNTGTIASGGAGVSLTNGGLVLNGASTAAIMGATYGVHFSQSYAKTLINFGTVAATGSAGVGVYVGGGFGIDAGIVVNHGTIIGAGGTAVAFGAASNGSNRLVVYPASALVGAVDGGGNAKVVFASAATAGTITGLGSEYLGVNNLYVALRASWAIGGDQTIGSGVELYAGGYSTLTATGTLTNAGIINVSARDTFIESGTLLNSGELLGSRFYPSLTLTSGGYLNNEAGGVAQHARASGTASIANAGTLAGVNLNNGAVLTNQSGGLASYYYYAIRGFNGTATVVNLGTVRSVPNGSGNDGAAIELTGSGGSVTNGAPTAAAALITGKSGLRIGGGAGTLVNYGTLLGSTPSYGNGYGVNFSGGGTVTNGAANDTIALISGYSSGVYGETSLVNFGTIVSTATLGGRGAVEPGGGIVVNGASSTTSALIAGYAGIFKFRGVTQSVVNYATIDATGTGTHAFGVYFGYGGSLENRASGLIESGATAVALTGTLATTVTNEGTIAGAVGITDTSDNTSNTIVVGGTIIGSSGTAIAFGCSPDLLVIQPGAVLQGAIAGFQTVDTIELAGIVADGLSFAGGTLTISSGGSVVQTIGLAGAFVGSDFVLSPDGTSITLSQPSGHVLSGSYDHTLLLTNPAQQNPMTLTSGTTLVASAGDGVVGTAGTDWTLSNAGTIGAVSSLHCADGVELASLGTVLNAGSIFASGTYGHGVTLAGGGFVSNSSPSAQISGYLAGIYASTSAVAANVVNAGTIMATGTSVEYGRYLAYAVFLGSGGSVSNSGLITGYRALVDRTGTFTNTGTVVGIYGAAVNANAVVNGTSGVTTALISGYDGVFASTLTNFGSIAAHGTRNAYGVARRSATIANFGTITSAGTYNSTFRDDAAGIEMSGTLINGATNATGALISGYAGLLGDYGAAIVSNFATIAASGTGGNADGVRLRQSGAVTNGAVADTVALISGYTGIYVPRGRYGSINTAQVTNLATISGTGSHGYGVLMGGATSVPGSVVNGSTADTAALIIGDSGVKLGGIGSVRNLGTIIGTGNIGVDMTGTASVINGATNITSALLRGPIGAEVGASGTVVNFATIGGAGTSGTGVKLVSGGSVTNQTSGLIAGAYGIHGVGSAGTVANFGTVIGQGGTDGLAIYLGRGGLVSNAASGTIANLSTVSTYAAVGLYHSVATLINAGLITAANGPGVYIGDGGTLVASGGVIAGATAAVRFFPGYVNRLIVDPGATFIGAVDGGNTIGATAVSTLDLASGASAGTLSGVATQFVNFAQTTIDAGAAWTLELPSPAIMHGSVSGFAAGDALDLAGVDPASVSLSSGTLDFAGGFFPLALSGAANVHAAADGSGGALVTVACFRAGTRIATPAGEVAVEALKVGDHVRLARGGKRCILWIGHRRIDCARHPRPETVWPVRIAAGAFGAGVPYRDLWLSPDHAVLLDGVLVPVKYLIDGERIVQVRMETVEYWHVELAQHDVLLAEGLPSESYLDTGDGASFDNGVTVRLVPEFRAADAVMREWEARACAPLSVHLSRANAGEVGAQRREGVSQHELKLYSRKRQGNGTTDEHR